MQNNVKIFLGQDKIIIIKIISDRDLQNTETVLLFWLKATEPLIKYQICI